MFALEIENEENRAIHIWNMRACGFRIASKPRTSSGQDDAYQ